MEANFKNTVEVTDAGNADIIRILEKNFPLASRQTKEFSKQFDAATITNIAENVWNFMKENFKYKADGQDHQKIVLPARALSQGKNFGIDCKSFALFAAANLSHYTNVGFRYSSYRNDPTPTHVYCIAKDEDGNTLVIDGVWNEFNSEKNYQHKKDHWMKISTLSGIEAAPNTNIPTIAVDEHTYHVLQSWNNVLNSAPPKSKDHKLALEHVKEIMQNIGLDKASIKAAQKMNGIGKNHWWQHLEDKVHSALKGAWNGFKHLNPTFSAMRNSYLALLDINYRGQASRIVKQLEIDPKPLEHLWHDNFGGNFQKLINAAKRGAKHKPFLGHPKGITGPEVVLAIIASAAPILALVSKLLPKGEKVEGSPSTDVNAPGYDPRADATSPQFDTSYAALHPNPGEGTPPDLPTNTKHPLSIFQKIFKGGKEVIETIAHIVNPQDASGATNTDEITSAKKEASISGGGLLLVGGVITGALLLKNKQ